MPRRVCPPQIAVLREAGEGGVGPRLTEVNDDIARDGASLMNAMLRISPPHVGQTSGSHRAQ